MTNDRRTAAIVGALFIVAMAASLLGGALVEAVLTEPDYLAQAAGRTPLITLGVALELVNALAVIGIAVALFPIFKRDSEGIALGYVGLRLLEAVALAAAAFIPVTVVALSREYATAEAGTRTSLEVFGGQLLATRAGLAAIMVPVFFCLGAVLLYTWIYRAKLLPRFIPVWGLAGVAGIAVVNVIDVGTSAALVLALPIILNELFLGGWLLLRGFSGTRSAPRAAVPAD